MACTITAILNDDGSVTIEPSSEYYKLGYEKAIGFITELKTELDESISNLEYQNLVV